MRRARMFTRLLLGAVIALGVVQIALLIDTRNVAVLLFGLRGFEFPIALTLVLIGGLLASRRPENPIGWLFCTSAIACALQGTLSEYAVFSIARHDATLPFTTAAAVIQSSLWVAIVAPLSAIAFLFYPSGRLLSKRWRGPLAFGVLANVFFMAAFFVSDQPLVHIQRTFANPYGVSWAKTAIAIGGMAFIASFVISFVALIIRFRRGSGEEREQVKWLAMAGSLLLLSLVATQVINGQSAGEGVAWRIAAQFTLMSLTGIAAAAAIAILKYRLYDIDVVISKAVVFSLIAVFITIVYVAVVVGVGTAAGNRGRPNLGLSILATAMVALTLQPIRERARTIANRMVFGDRATPYEALSGFATKISDAYSMDEVLPRLARLMTEATAGERSAVWLCVGAELRPESSWPEGQAISPVHLPEDELPTISGFDHAYPVRHQGELLGALTVATRPSEPLTPTEDKVLRDLAAQAGLVLRNVRLIADLQASRQRLVAAQDQERHRIERNLHDGAQQELIALKLKLGIARTLLDTDPAVLGELLEQLKTEASDALDNLRALAHGIYPPMLAERGLAAALRSQAEKAIVPVSVEADGLERYHQDAEAAIYFCVLECLQNASKYSQASQARIELSGRDGRLRFAVGDDGRGFDARTTARGAGLTNMTDRIESLGGALTVRSAPGEGTEISGWIPALQTVNA